MSTSPTDAERARLVLRCAAGAPAVLDPSALLLRARHEAQLELRTDADSVGLVLRTALGFSGETPLVLEGRGSLLEWTGAHWRLGAHNALDPLHGANLVDDLYSPPR